MPRKPLNLIGMKFDKLTPIRMLDEVGGAGIHKRWECQCDCGRVVIVESANLKNGSSKQCPACRQSRIKVGDVYENWEVLGYSRVVYTLTKNHYSYWLCQCQCGKVKEVVGDNLLQGKSTKCQSCSLTKHGLSETKEYRNHKWREYYEKKRELDGEWTLEMTAALRQYFIRCVVCGMTLEQHYQKYNQSLHIDHVRPLSKKHGLQLGNAVILCYTCNTSKSARELDQLPAEWRDKILSAAEEFKQAWESGFRA